MTADARTALLCFGLTLLVVASAIAVIYARHESRSLFTQLESLVVQRDALEVDWGRLQIEQSAYSAHSRVERYARVEMKMRTPAPHEIRVVQQ